MNLKLAAQLKDIHLPAEPGFWPLAFGWWILLALIILSVVVLFWLLRRYKKGAARREALLQLQQIEEIYISDKDGEKYYSDISKLLRRVAITAFSREQCAGLSGESWLGFLRSHAPDGGFDDTAGRDLIQARFKNHSSQPDTTAINSLVESWIRRNL